MSETLSLFLVLGFAVVMAVFAAKRLWTGGGLHVDEELGEVERLYVEVLRDDHGRGYVGLGWRSTEHLDRWTLTPGQAADLARMLRDASHPGGTLAQARFSRRRVGGSR